MPREQDPPPVVPSPVPTLLSLGTVSLVEGTGASAQHVALQPKRLALLAFLARRAGGQLVRRDELVALFWPETDEAHGRGVLRQALHALRRQAGPGVLVTRGDDEVGVAPGGLRCDANEFSAACAAGEHASALALYRGDFLAGFHVAGASSEFERWVDDERHRLRQLAATAAWALSEAAERAGQSADAVRWARQAVAYGPEDEPGVARLVALLDRQGDRAGALKVYAELERRLREEYATSPSPETRALLQALLQRPVPVGGAAPAAGPTPPPAAAPAPAPGPRRQPWRMGVVLAAGIAMVLAARLPSTGRRAPSRSAPVAIIPFTITTADTSLRWLQEGMVELLAVRLEGEAGLPLADPGRVLGAWQREQRTASSTSAPDVELVATAVGAGRVITGSATGTHRRLVLTAALRSVGDERVIVRAVAEGPADSVAVLTDRLATQLLGADAGVTRDQVPPVIAANLPAVRAFLLGRAAFRAGRTEEAVRRYREAIALDTTFALAGLDLMRAARWVTAQHGDDGAHVALANRDRLGEADRMLLDALAGQVARTPDQIRLFHELALRHPDRPEIWYSMGDEYFHEGALAGIDDALQRAEDAFRRGWHLDSAAAANRPSGLRGPVPETAEHSLQLAHIRGDTAAVRSVAAAILAADSSSDLAHYARWHLAVLDGAAARDAYWAGSAGISGSTTIKIVLFIAWTGIGAEDLERAYEEDMRQLRVTRPAVALYATRLEALNGGRPSRVPPAAGSTESALRAQLRDRVRDAVWWSGDTGTARAAADRLARFVAAAPPAAWSADVAQDVCTLALWHATRGEADAAMRMARPIRAHQPRSRADTTALANHDQLCLALLDASLAGGPEGRRLVAVADSLSRTYAMQVCCEVAVLEANLVLARLWERDGDAPRALAAVRRGAGAFMDRPLYLSTFAREEGRLAALVGDTAAAARAYTHYLALRPAPEPSLQPEVDEVRRRLAELRRGRATPTEALR